MAKCLVIVVCYCLMSMARISRIKQYWYCLAHLFSIKKYDYAVLAFFVLILLGRTFQCQTVLVCCTGILCTDTVWHNFSVPNSISILYWYSLYWYCLGKLFNAKQYLYVVLAFFILILFGNGFSVSTSISISNKHHHLHLFKLLKLSYIKVGSAKANRRKT